MCCLRLHFDSSAKSNVMQCDELGKSVITAFNSIDACVFDKLHERWKLVLHLIMSGKGTNEDVEQHCRLDKKLTDLPTIADDDEDKDQEYEQVKMMHELNINGDDFAAGDNDGCF